MVKYAIIFWDTNGWYYNDVTQEMCDNQKHVKLQEAITDANQNGYEILDVRKTRGSFKIRTKYDAPKD